MQRENYPRPDAVRPRIRILNGDWQFLTDFTSECPPAAIPTGTRSICVPFAAGTERSGVDTTASVAHYFRTFNLDEFEKAGTVLLNFSALDGYAEIYLNGKPVCATHTAALSTHADISALAQEGENLLYVFIRSDSGHTRGIWGDVWLEFAAKSYFRMARAIAVYNAKSLYIQGGVQGEVADCKIKVEIAYKGKQIASYNYKANTNFTLEAPLNREPEVWQIGSPKLYDVRLTLLNAKGGICDTLYTYCAFREINLFENSLYINGKKVFLRAVADASLYDGAGNTAPDAEAIATDYARLLALGFNTIQFTDVYPSFKHLYILDKLGIAARVELLGCAPQEAAGEQADMINRENAQLIMRDLGHPSILTWIPFKDFSGSARAQVEAVNNIKQLDLVRVIPGTSGGKTYAGDIFEFRMQDANPDSLKGYLYLRMNGGIYTEKEEQKLYKHDRALLTPEALQALPVYVGKLYSTELRKGDLISENKYLDTYEKLYDLIAASGAIGYTFYCFTDAPECGAILAPDRSFLLSKQGVTRLIKINKRPALCEQ